MDKSEIDNARTQAGSIVNALTPILRAMEQAGGVLSVLSGAEKHRAALTAEVESLKNDAATLQESVRSLETQRAALQAEVAKAELEAKAAAREAALAAEEKAKAAEAAAAARATAAEKAAAEKEAAFTQHILDVQRNTDAEIAALFTRQQTAADAAAAAEAKLQAVRDQAAKMAAAIGG